MNQHEMTAEPLREYTCTELRAIDIITGDDPVPPCCPSCHRINGIQHDSQEEDEDHMEHVQTPRGRWVSLCCNVYNYTSLHWLEERITAYEATSKEENKS